MNRLIDGDKLIDHINVCANDLYDRGGIVPSGVLVILRDTIEEGEFDIPSDQGEGARLREALNTIASIKYDNLSYGPEDAECMNRIAIETLSSHREDTGIQLLSDAYRRVSQTINPHNGWRCTWYKRVDGSRFSVGIPRTTLLDNGQPAGFAYDDDQEKQMADHMFRMTIPGITGGGDNNDQKTRA